MAIDLATGFNIGSKDAIDERQVLTLEQMKNLDESIYPDKYFAICKDDGKLYLYGADNEVSDETGKFRVLEGGISAISGNITENVTGIWKKEYTSNMYNLIAKIKLSDVDLQHHVLSFSCLNQTAVNYLYTVDSSVYKFDIHFITPQSTNTYVNKITLKQYGFTLYEYPSPTGTIEGISNIAEHIKGYVDATNRYVYIYLIDEDAVVTPKIPNVLLKYTGDGTIEQSLETHPFTSWGGHDFEWEEVCELEDLESPTIVPIGGDGGSTEGATTYTSLTELGLTADATFQDVVDTLPKGGSALLGVTEFTNYQTIFPYEEGNDQFSRVHIVKGTEDGSRVYARWFRKDGVKEAIAIFNINDNTFGGWQILKNQQIYTSLTELGLDTTATLNDIVGAMKDGTTFTYKTDVFDYATEYNNIQHGTVTIDKQSTARVQVLMTDKNTGNLYVGRMDTNNLFVGWRNCSFHRIVTQATAGYFKFKPTSDGGFEQPLRTSITDNYGGMIEISGSAPSQTQYKPFKCVRLSHGTYTDYNASNPANNKMEKLFFLDGYMYLQVASYTTVTITGLIGVPTFVETIDDGAEEIPIVSAIATQYDGYGDPYIISIGDSVSGDGSIQTLASLGLSTDIMTWKNGIYKVSHVSGITGLPSDITNTSPGFRLEHHNIKKWNSNHNPSSQTWGQRHSIIYCDNGNVYHRFYESGATAGTYITDTGWQKIQTSRTKATLVTNTATLKLDVTKRNSAWYGAVKLTYLYAASPAEIEISFGGATDNLNWAIINGQRYVKQITFTQDSGNASHYTIGIEFSGTTYGCYQAEVIGDFANINSLTSESFTGTKTAGYSAPWGKNNGVTLVSAPGDIGLSYPCTTVQLAQTMRNKFNVGVKCGAIGIFNCEGKTVTITDAPSDYGLLHIETFGHDRILIRFDSIGSSTYNGSWIGRIKGNNGTFSSILWEREDNNYSTTEQVVGTWIDGSTVYRTTIAYTFTGGAYQGDTAITIGNVSGCKLLVKMEGVVRTMSTSFKTIPYYRNSSNYGELSFSSYNGNLLYTGSSLSEGAQIFVTMEYTKS